MSVGVLLVCAGFTSAAQASSGLATGFFGDSVFSSNATTESLNLGHVVSEGASFVRVNVNWYGVAPAKRPKGFDPAKPTSPGYDWTAVDREIRAMHAHGLTVLLNIWGAPTWAEGPHKPRSARPGTWQPNSAALASFARAAALRYSGHFPDPLNPGASLPRVRDWQAWNEPNLNFYLAPQWKRVHGGYAPVAPVLFRAMTNAFYAAVKRVSGSNFVVLAGTAPYGDPPGGTRTQPVAFFRTLFCLSGAVRLTPVNCPNPVHFDALDHHPYAVGGPLQTALNVDDVAVPDIGKLTRVLRAAQRAGHVLPGGHKRLWVTEISWDSSPPDPQGVPIATQARWLEQSLYVLWRQGVDTVMWYQLVDSPPIPDFASTYQAGIYYLTGAAKPSATAFRFPFVTQRLDRGRIRAWGRAPVGGTAQLEILRSGHWTTLRQLAVGTRGIFQATLNVSGRAALRAQIGSQTSLSWSQGA
jgi:hypothetical protein